jgi:hypothetical protein
MKQFNTVLETISYILKNLIKKNCKSKLEKSLMCKKGSQGEDSEIILEKKRARELAYR